MEKNKRLLGILVDDELYDALLAYSLAKGHNALAKGVREILLSIVSTEEHPKRLREIAARLAAEAKNKRKNKNAFIRYAAYNLGFTDEENAKRIHTLLKKELRNAENNEPEKPGRASRGKTGAKGTQSS